MASRIGPSRAAQLVPCGGYGPDRTEPGTTYYWYIEAANTAGSTAGTAWSFTTAGIACATPAAPQNVTAPTQAGSGAAFDVTWNSVSGATAYVIEEANRQVNDVFSNIASAL